MYFIAKFLLFQFDAERIHRWVTFGLRALIRIPLMRFGFRFLFRYHRECLAFKLFNLEFDNPLGMAAGFDKTGELYPALSNMGFGFVESGTFTALAQPGNPRPRLFRYARQKALINRMGFNNPGCQAVASLVKPQKRTVPRGINIGKSKLASLTEARSDYLQSLRCLYDYGDYIAINVSSPNTPGLRELQNKSELTDLLGAIQLEIQSLAKSRSKAPKALFVKIAPDMSSDQLHQTLDICVEKKLAGIIISNTTLDHSSIDPDKDQQGGLSGRALTQRSTAMIYEAYKYAGEHLVIIGVGGIFTANDAIQKLAAGATLLQVYTGYIYQGPAMLKRINRGIVRFLKARQLAHVCEIRGLAHIRPELIELPHQWNEIQ